MYFASTKIFQLKSILLLSALLAVSASCLQAWAGERLDQQPVGETSETCEVELESESECKDGFELVLPQCFVIDSAGFDASQLQAPPLEQLLQVVLEQNAPRPPPVLLA